MLTAKSALNELKKHSRPKRVNALLRFFKTEEGQYGYGDKFLGADTPSIRNTAKLYKNLPLSEVELLLKSDLHEVRVLALVIMATKFRVPENQSNIYDLYLNNTKYINNWDLVDISAHKIVGEYLKKTLNPSILYSLAGSKSIWERRIAVVASFSFLKEGDSKISMQLAEMLLNDKEDLIQKAVGWMLREVGKKCGQGELTKFLDKHAHEMPRTMLRYSLEKLTIKERLFYMNMKTKVVQKPA